VSTPHEDRRSFRTRRHNPNPEKLGGWLMTTARRECLAQIRRQRTERPLATSDTDQPFPNPHRKLW
jgi:DNA-directed RNA polymerase specialized sigma24 family protein